MSSTFDSLVAKIRSIGEAYCQNQMCWRYPHAIRRRTETAFDSSEAWTGSSPRSINSITNCTATKTIPVCG